MMQLLNLRSEKRIKKSIYDIFLTVLKLLFISIVIVDILMSVTTLLEN